MLGRRPRVVIGHPFLGRGGSEARVMWLIEALKRDCDVTVVTTGGWNLDELNLTYGTQVRPCDANVRLAPFPWLLRRYPLAMLRWAYYQRYCREIAGEFDVRISAYNCTDWGSPAIQFIADFAWDPASRKRDGGPSPGLFYRDTMLRKAYLGAAQRLMRPSGRDLLREDFVVANSHWTAHRLVTLGARVRALISPEIVGSFANVPWSERENAFVSISRIAPEKRIEFIIEVLAAVRRRGFPVSLWVAGKVERDPYGRLIEDLCRKHADWVHRAGYVTGEAKAELLSRVRYGFSACPHEAFGISVAEMTCAGCISFVHAETGAAEIVDHPALLFTDAAEAEERIVAVLGSERLQAELRDHLARRAEVFGVNNVLREFRRVVGDFLRETAG